MTEPIVPEYYYADADAKPVGPLSAEKLRDLRHRGILTDETLVIEVAGTEWVPYRSLGKGVTLPPVPVPAKGGFLLATRLITAVILFIAFAVAIYFAAFYGTAAVGGLAAAFRNGDFATGYQLGWSKAVDAQAIISLASLAVGAIAAIALSFSNALPWCRRRQAHRLARR